MPRQHSSLWFYLEVCLCGPALLWLYLRDRVLTQQQKDTSPTLRQLFYEQSTALLRHVRSLRRRPSIRLDMVSPWAGGSGLQGEWAGDGEMYPRSCSLSTWRATVIPTLSVVTTQGSCSSVRIGGQGNGTPTTDPLTSRMGNVHTTPTAGLHGPGTEGGEK